MRATVAVGSLFALVASACRPDPGVPDYTPHVGVRSIEPDAEFLPGPNPFDPSEPRLDLGRFYEGGLTHRVFVDGVSFNYYIFESTYEEEYPEDRVEGTESTAWVLTGKMGFWGGGLFYDRPYNLREWTTLHVSFKSSDASFAEIPINLQSGSAKVDSTVEASTYGYRNDGAWHSLTIPLADFPNLDPWLVYSPFYIAAPGTRAGDVLLIDDLYYTRE